MKTAIEKANATIEAQAEFAEFERAIRLPQPAVKTFTNEALMLVYLMLGKKALKTMEAQKL